MNYNNQLLLAQKRSFLKKIDGEKKYSARSLSFGMMILYSLIVLFVLRLLVG